MSDAWYRRQPPERRQAIALRNAGQWRARYNAARKLGLCLCGAALATVRDRLGSGCRTCMDDRNKRAKETIS